MTPPSARHRAPFVDRRSAGRLLAAELDTLRPKDPLVVALPRGGVPVAREIAARLGAPLEVFGVRKLAHPDRPEVAFGAVTEDGMRLVDPEAAHLLGLRGGDVELVTELERAELRRRIEVYRHGAPFPDVHGRTVVVVDDGVATGLTDAAAIRAIRRLGAAEIVLAVPVCSGPAMEFLEGEADTVVALRVPTRFRGVGGAYLDFGQVSDQEVIDALAGPARAAA